MASATIACLCGAIAIPLSSPLPAQSHLCHCDTCRRSTGALFTGLLPLDTPPAADQLTRCTIYRSSDSWSQYFCSTCGTKVVGHARGEPTEARKERWYCFGGAVDPPQQEATKNLLCVHSHKWVADTLDGGMAAFMTTLGGRDIQCFEGDENSQQLTHDEVAKMHASALRPSHELGSGDILRAECRCGGVSLRIKRANHEDKSVSKLDRFIPKDDSGQPENDRYMAFACVCRFCRLGSGCSFSPWMYLPPQQVLNAHTNRAVVQHREATDGSEATREANQGLSLTHFWSSENSCRSFCSRCGATVFYSFEKRLEILNVAVGLLRAEEGALARRWLRYVVQGCVYNEALKALSILISADLF